VVLKQGVAVSDLNGALKEHVKQKIGPWKYPRWIGWWRACRRPRPERFEAFSSCVPNKKGMTRMVLNLRAHLPSATLARIPDDRTGAGQGANDCHAA
jgi:hypothetical protein